MNSQLKIKKFVKTKLIIIVFYMFCFNLIKLFKSKYVIIILKLNNQYIIIFIKFLTGF